MSETWSELRDRILRSDAPQRCAVIVLRERFAEVAREFLGDDLLPRDSARISYAQLLKLHDAVIALEYAFAARQTEGSHAGP